MRHVEKPVRKSYRFHEYTRQDLEQLVKLTGKSETKLVEEAITAYLQKVLGEKQTKPS